jgi:DNA modification methylase
VPKEKVLTIKSSGRGVVGIMIKINNKDVLEDLKSYPEFEFNTIFSDPPYNLGTEWVIDAWGKPVPKGSTQEFMGKKWGVDWEVFFQESYKVLKYGGYCILFCIDRCTLPLEYYATLAGFETCQHLYWYQIQGFPKSLAVGKAIDKKLGKEREVVDRIEKNIRVNSEQNHKEGQVGKYGFKADGTGVISIPSSPLAKQYEGYHAGVAPMKPCLETILCFRKPLKNGGYIDDILENSKSTSPACLNINGGRVKTDDKMGSAKGISISKIYDRPFMHDEAKIKEYAEKARISNEKAETLGRYPSQLFVNPEAAEKLDEQSGDLTSGTGAVKKSISKGHQANAYGKESRPEGTEMICYGGEGGASKILHVCQYDLEEYEIINYCAKVSGHERNAGCDELPEKQKTEDYEGCDTRCSVCGKYFLSGDDPCECDEEEVGSKAGRAINPVSRNNHPTLKPMSLINKLAILFKLPEAVNQKVYIPCSGAGSEIIGFLSAGFKPENIQGCELNPEFIEIAHARIKYWTENNYYFILDSKEQNGTKARIKEKESIKKTFRKMF